jgi:homoserine O-acetyltransferase/O-succinyltransferase
MFPDMVERIAPFCGSAKCSRHNFVFLEGVKAALTGDPAFAGGWYKSPPTQGLRAMGRVYAGWGLSQDFYRLELDKSVLGFASLEDFLVGFWEGLFLPRDANNLLCMLWTWQHGDLAKNKEFGGDFPKALQAITANTLIMPCDKDLYFPPKDNEIEVQHMRAGGGNCSTNVKYVVIESPWGHFAGGPGLCKEDTKFVDAQIKDLLSK